MKQRLPGRWLGIGVLASTLVFGCRHASETCDCGSTVQAMPSVIVSPDYRQGQQNPGEGSPYSSLPAPAADAARTATAAEAKVPDTILPAAAVRNTETTPAMVQVTVVAPDSPGAASTTGTIELTAADAEAMGIRPGYTPGALFVAAKPQDSAVLPALATSTSAGEQEGAPSQNTTGLEVHSPDGH